MVHYAGLTHRFDWMDKTESKMICVGTLLALQKVVALDRFYDIDKMCTIFSRPDAFFFGTESFDQIRKMTHVTTSGVSSSTVELSISYGTIIVSLAHFRYTTMLF